MNNLKHTPGSWHVDGHNLTAVISKINEHHYKHICTCDYGYSHPEEHFELNKANAKLIAASPLLLEALIQVRRHGLIEKDGYETLVKQIGEAIAKAIE